MKHKRIVGILQCLVIGLAVMLLAACETLKVRYCEEPPLTQCVCPLEPLEPVYCPEPMAWGQDAVVASVATIDDKRLIGQVESVLLIPGELVLPARIDTGAGISSLHAHDMTFFERDTKAWVRFALTDPDTDEDVYIERPVNRYVRIKTQDSYQRRPVVSMTLVLGDIEEQVDVTLADRSNYIYQVLVGRNFLQDRAIVDVSDEFTTTPEG